MKFRNCFISAVLFVSGCMLARYIVGGYYKGEATWEGAAMVAIFILVMSLVVALVYYHAETELMPRRKKQPPNNEECQG